MIILKLSTSRVGPLVAKCHLVHDSHFISRAGVRCESTTEILKLKDRTGSKKLSLRWLKYFNRKALLSTYVITSMVQRIRSVQQGKICVHRV